MANSLDGVLTRPKRIDLLTFASSYFALLVVTAPRDNHRPLGKQAVVGSCRLQTYLSYLQMVGVGVHTADGQLLGAMTDLQERFVWRQREFG